MRSAPRVKSLYKFVSVESTLASLTGVDLKQHARSPCVKKGAS